MMLRSIIVFTERFCFYEVLVGTIPNGFDAWMAFNFAVAWF